MRRYRLRIILGITPSVFFYSDKRAGLEELEVVAKKLMEDATNTVTLQYLVGDEIVASIPARNAAWLVPA